MLESKNERVNLEDASSAVTLLSALYSGGKFKNQIDFKGELSAIKYSSAVDMNFKKSLLKHLVDTYFSERCALAVKINNKLKFRVN